MPDREKVIRGLECLGHENYSDNPCAGCGYRDCQTFAVCIGEVARDALSLLKSQEPRLLTEADFVNADHYGYMPAWAEEKNGDQFWKIVRVASLGLDKKRLRYWTSRPTDEQREAVKWE